MPHYELHEATLELPRGYDDASMNSLSFSRPSGELDVFVSRAPTVGASLESLVRLRLAEMRRALPAFELLRQAELVVDGERSVEIEIIFSDRGIPRLQRQLFILVDDLHGANQKKLVTLGVHAHADARADIAEVFEGAVASLAVRRDPS